MACPPAALFPAGLEVKQMKASVAGGRLATKGRLGATLTAPSRLTGGQVSSRGLRPEIQLHLKLTLLVDFLFM